MPFIKMVLLTLISIINNVCMDTGSISRKGSTKINYTSILTQDMEYVKRIYTIVFMIGYEYRIWYPEARQAPCLRNYPSS